MFSARVSAAAFLLFARLAAAATSSNCNLTECGIFCYAPLLKAAADAELFHDSKTFVDCSLKTDPCAVLDMFNNLSPNTSFSTFFISNFNLPNNTNELEPFEAPDFNPTPQIATQMNSQNRSDWARWLNEMWRDLGRQMNKTTASVEPDRHSLLFVDHPFVVPGGRFREIYYWDTYWIVRGLLICNMTTTATSVVHNLLSFVERYGFVPNGGRSYYLTRTQPPFLTLIVSALLNQLPDADAHSFLVNALPLLVQEHKVFTSGPRLIESPSPAAGLSRFWGNTTAPRPESFKEDTETAANLSPQEAEKLYNNIAAAAESGWDFSSRWFKDYASLSQAFTTDVVPVCLNSVLLRVEKELAKMFQSLGNQSQANYYVEMAANRSAIMNSVMFDLASNQWRDFDMTSNQQRKEHAYASNFLPLWAGVETPSGSSPQRISGALRDSGLVQPGGLMTSNVNSTQQWDMPNAWAPVNEMVIEGLENVGEFSLALSLAESWLSSNMEFWAREQNMAEKMNAMVPGQRGAGGEYTPQQGFGWSNGVALILLQKYAIDASPSPSPSSDPSGTSPSTKHLYIGLTAGLVVMIAGVLGGVWWVTTRGQARKDEDDHIQGYTAMRDVVRQKPQASTPTSP